MPATFYSYAYTSDLTYPWSPTFVNYPSVGKTALLLSVTDDTGSPGIQFVDLTCTPVGSFFPCRTLSNGAGVGTRWNIAFHGAIGAGAGIYVVPVPAAPPPPPPPPQPPAAPPVPKANAVAGWTPLMTPLASSASVVRYPNPPLYPSSNSYLASTDSMVLGWAAASSTEATGTIANAPTPTTLPHDDNWPNLVRQTFLPTTDLPAFLPPGKGTVLFAASGSAIAVNALAQPAPTNWPAIANCKYLLDVGIKGSHDLAPDLWVVKSFHDENNNPQLAPAALGTGSPGPILSNAVADSTGRYLFYAVWNNTTQQCEVLAWDGQGGKKHEGGPLWTNNLAIGDMPITGDLAISGTTLYAADLDGNVYIITNATSGTPTMQKFALGGGWWLTGGVSIYKTPNRDGDLICVAGSTFGSCSENTAVWAIKVGNSDRPTVPSNSGILPAWQPPVPPPPAAPCGLMPFLQRQALNDNWLAIGVVTSPYPPSPGSSSLTVPMTLFLIDVTTLSPIE